MDNNISLSAQKFNFDLMSTVEEILLLIPSIPEYHNPNTKLYVTLNKIIKSYFTNLKGDCIDVKPFQGMIWPHINCGTGTFDSYDFFDLHELIIYLYYWNRRNDYKYFCELGGSIGIDTVILNKFGYEVTTFEPDPKSFEVLCNNLNLNNCKNVEAFNKAISSVGGSLDFVRVKGQTLANHVKGLREFYGESEEIQVEANTWEDIDFKNFPNLTKINIEGSEIEVVPSIPHSDYEKMDVFIEIHNEESARVIFDYLFNIVNISSQKTGWDKVNSFEDFPKMSKDGYIFTTPKENMDWF